MKICKCLNLSDCLIASLKYLRYFFMFFLFLVSVYYAYRLMVNKKFNIMNNY